MILAAALAAAAACTLPAGWDAVEAKRPRLVVLGEVHGTAEAPALTGAIACALVKQRKRLLVALEQNAGDDAALQAAWRGDPAAFAAALPQALRWRGRQDGMASSAMYALLIRLHALRRAGHIIDVVAFSGPIDAAQDARFRHLPGQGGGEAIKAENITRAANAKPYDRILVLVGNLHAMKQPVGKGGRAFQPMTMRMPRRRLLSLVLMNGPGAMWNCVEQKGRADEVECGAHPTTGMGGLERLRAPAVVLGVPPSIPAPQFPYDGYIWIGPVTASPPATPGSWRPS